MKTSFVIRRRKRNILFWALIAALFFWPPIVVVVITGIEASSSFAPQYIYIYVIALMIAIVGTAPTIKRIIWKCTIEGEQIEYRSLLYRKDFTFQDIERVVFRKRIWSSVYAETDLSFWHIFLKDKRLPIKVPDRSFRTDDFVRCLRQRNIPGL